MFRLIDVDVVVTYSFVKGLEESCLEDTVGDARSETSEEKAEIVLLTIVYWVKHVLVIDAAFHREWVSEIAYVYYDKGRLWLPQAPSKGAILVQAGRCLIEGCHMTCGAECPRPVKNVAAGRFTQAKNNPGGRLWTKDRAPSFNLPFVNVCLVARLKIRLKASALLHTVSFAYFPHLHTASGDHDCNSTTKPKLALQAAAQ
jgi:hypothetical protein